MTNVEFWRDCPEVEINAEKLHREPTVGPYRVAARTLVESDELGGTAEEIAADYSLPLDKVRAILSYYHAHQPEPEDRSRARPCYWRGHSEEVKPGQVLSVFRGKFVPKKFRRWV
jgi:uncharacterized protein (DUF433 family)